MEQLAARWAHNPKVVGSSPAPATNRNPYDYRKGFFYMLLTTLSYPNITYLKNTADIKKSVPYFSFSIIPLSDQFPKPASTAKGRKSP